MRFSLNLLAVFALIHCISAQSLANDIHCNFQYRFEVYTCFLTDTTILTETAPLRFFGAHLPNHNDSHVTKIDSFTIPHVWPRNITIRVVHPQLLQHFPNIQVMELRQSMVETLVSDSFVRCDELATLRLNNNHLETIPPRVFQNCAKLEWLDLNNNHISSLTGESFSGLHSLEALTLANNRLNQVVPNAFQDLVNLEGLELSRNPITAIGPTSFNGLQNLEFLLLNNIQISNLIPGMFEQLRNLTTLSIRDVSTITFIPPNVFAPLPNLRFLELIHNSITRLHSNSFGYLPNLERFDISHSNWNLGLNAIERNFFANFPRLEQFGGPTGGSCDGRVRGIVNMTSKDFSRETIFDGCFYFFEGISTTTTTGPPNTTPDNNAATDMATKFSFSMILIVMVKVLVF